ncbi:DUF4126 domain-containing protein [Acidobacteria bacterium AH-259-G07]|nr:DUF4126 domain-containing protein [Acidobacteria bacterium AH-259-G07]
MMNVTNVALALGASLTAGLNLYITILTLGLMDYFEILDLPENLEVLSNPWVLVTAGVLFTIEFVTDKIPYLDNTWDAIHSFIRIPAGAVLAASALGDAPEHLIWVAALVGGFVSLAAHGAKASTRLAINTTPEPFTNWFVSLFEDTLSLVVLWLVSTHPYLALGLIVLLVGGCLTLIYLFYHFFKMLFRRREPSIQPPP